MYIIPYSTAQNDKDTSRCVDKYGTIRNQKITIESRRECRDDGARKDAGVWNKAEQEPEMNEGRGGEFQEMNEDGEYMVSYVCVRAWARL